MKGILTIILCLILFIGIVLAILFHETVRNFRKILQKAAEAREARRQAEEDAYFKRTSSKYYREEAPQFAEDYFKGNNEQEKYDHSRFNNNTTSRPGTETGNRVTIIDSRQKSQANKKIFDDSEGEYVDFEEVRSEE